MKKIFSSALIFVFLSGLLFFNIQSAYCGKVKTEKMKVTGVEGQKCLDIIKAEVKKIKGIMKVSFSNTDFKEKSTIANIFYIGDCSEVIKKAITAKGYNVECMDDSNNPNSADPGKGCCSKDKK